MIEAEAWIGLGANLGDRASTLDAALERIDALADTGLDRVSRYYFTAPWGETDQPEFLNAVAVVTTRQSAADLLHALLKIESDLGRERRGKRWGPRVIDLDLLLHGEARIDEPDLVVPHPRMADRAFVLVPALELDAGLSIPGRGRADALLAQLDDNERAGVRPGPRAGYPPSKLDRETR